MSSRHGRSKKFVCSERWAGYHMAHKGKWYYAYTIEGDTIFIEDACHAQNIHDK
ncbi:MAG: hypothetical protein J6M36_02875 [Prevotella sp.]|nr:hypothetical protein [Prevotella sp.]